MWRRAVASRAAILCAVAWAGGLMSPGWAGEITALESTSGPGLGQAAVSGIVTPDEGNDNVDVRSPNQVDFTVRFDKTAYIDLVFTVGPVGGISEYYFNAATPDGFINNNTGNFWRGMLFELGFGTGANFIRSNGFDALDFDEPYVSQGGTGPDPVPTSSDFASRFQPPQPDLILWTNGLVAPGANTEFTFSTDVPDVNAEIPEAYRFSSSGDPLDIDSYRFTLRITPIPEPASLALALAGLLMAGLARALRGHGRRVAS
jgi:hypothetical protein